MHLFLGRKRKAYSEATLNSLDGASSCKAPKKRSSRLFGITSFIPSSLSSEESPRPTTRHNLRVKASRFFAKMMPSKAADGEVMVDGASARPSHRTATPRPSAMAADGNAQNHKNREAPDFVSGTGRSNGVQPRRKRSVRFKDHGACMSMSDQLDGVNHGSHGKLAAEHGGVPMNEPRASESSNRSQKTSEPLEALTAKFNLAAGTDTVVHRARLKEAPNVPFIETSIEPLHFQNNIADHFSPSTASSATASLPDLSSMWSPASTTSTRATSFTSLGTPSPGSRHKRTTPEDCQFTSKNAGHADENLLPPIEEDVGRYLHIPVQETMVDIQPSVMTVENAAAAKCALETYHITLMEASSPRSIRRKKFEQRMCDVGMPFEERDTARRAWVQAESDHLRQVRVLKASSIQRHNTKGISIAGYDTVRVLGKGSFGVVRLVTEGRPKSSDDGDGKDEGHDEEKRRRSSSGAFAEGVAKRNLPAGRPLPDVYAMKVIRKSEMLRASQEGHLRAERDFLVASEGSRWVVPLVASFQDNTNLYLVMDYMIGGDFLGLLLREDVLEEGVARYASGHLKISDFGLAFNGHWAHSQAYYNDQRKILLEKIGIKIHGDEYDTQEELDGQRDGTDSKGKTPMKPDPEEGARREGLLNWRNRIERRKLARSVVGTSQYMAPEVVQGQPYDGRCDWWSIAIILYECLYGRTPFYCENRQKTKEAIVNHRATLDFPENERWARPTSDSKRWLPAPTDVAVDLMRQVLTDKEARLSSRQYRIREGGIGRRLSVSSNNNSLLTRHVYPNGAEEIKNHKFFHGIPWSQLHMMAPPFVPRVKQNQSITKYFEDEKDIISDESSSYMSIKDKISREQLDRGLSEEDLATVLGHHYPRWKADRTKIEKHELGLDECSDDELQRIKEHFGNQFEHWRAERLVEVAEARIEQGIEDAPPGVRQKKERKRARDKMLRDPTVGKQCMELRKRGAFFGYTYRRPRTLELREVGSGNERTRVRGVGSRPTILPVAQTEGSGIGSLRAVIGVRENGNGQEKEG
ncbi:hypothetical protein DOTSEDRAFT_36105 [Dothistroma septosporum NZE10]|uniref:non-specific serine/threonine protein kinase n=1 Tax=Dothistroma septosporum (strain NZE10 / CBS 128990) TaxID=675120 RepID=N1PLK6_DOTSN|nr:hypothetical protein DOTSEDRAFT_36105 [Dothistroma septosporum NZE10]